MFWLFGTKKRIEELDKKTEQGFSSVKNDIASVGKWIKHLDTKDKQLFDIISELKRELTSIKDEVGVMRESFDLLTHEEKEEQVFKKLPVLDKQSTVEDVQEAVQTAVQTGNYYENLKRLSGNERLLIFTLLNSDMKLSYEDLSLLLGKERSTIRGQINAIKQKSEDLVREIVEKNGKKRVYIPDEMREKLQKYAKVRVNGKKNARN